VRSVGDSSEAGKALRIACKLNLGSCYLNTGWSFLSSHKSHLGQKRNMEVQYIAH
jgi:hypothetical protein